MIGLWIAIPLGAVVVFLTGFWLGTRAAAEEHEIRLRGDFDGFDEE